MLYTSLIVCVCTFMLNFRLYESVCCCFFQLVLIIIPQQGILQLFCLFVDIVLQPSQHLYRQYFGQLGLKRHGIDANKNGFSKVRFVAEKKPRKTLVILYAHAQGTVLELMIRLAAESSGLQGLRWIKTSPFFRPAATKLCLSS